MPLHDDYLADMLAKKRGEPPPPPPISSIPTSQAPSYMPYWIVAGTIVVVLVLIRVLFFGGSDPTPQPITRGTEPKFTKLPDGGFESDPVLIGSTPVEIKVWGNYCLLRGKDGDRVKALDLKEHMASVKYVSLGDRARVTFYQYPIDHKNCAD